MMTRLFRPRTDRMIAGVCGGLGRYFAIDPVIVRLLFVVLLLFSGVSALLYPVLWLVMPDEEYRAPLPPDARFDPQTGQPLSAQPTTEQTVQLEPTGTPSSPPQHRNRHLAVILVGVGGMVLLSNLGNVFGVNLGSIAVPLLLIGVGVYLLRGDRVR